MNALAVYNGTLYAGGTFSPNLKSWNGSSWTSVSGLSAGLINVLAVHHNRLVVGGAFATSGGLPTSGLSDFDGANWTTFNSNVYIYNPGGTSMYLLKSINGTLYAGGILSLIISVPYAGILSWDGANWGDATSGAGMAMQCTYAMTANGGTYSVAAGGLKGVVQSSGSSWSQVGNGLGNASLTDGASSVFALEWFHGKLFAGGTFTNSGPSNIVCMACWNGSAWSPAGGGVSGSQPYVFCSAIYNNQLIIGGQFTHADGKVIANIAKFVDATAVISSPSMSTNGQFSFSASGPVGSSVAVETSADIKLNAWTGLQTNIMGVNPFVFSDPQSVAKTIRFYRLRVLP